MHKPSLLLFARSFGVFCSPFVGPDGTLAAFREPLFLGAHGLYGPPHLFTGKVLPLQGDAELIFKMGQLYKR